MTTYTLLHDKLGLLTLPLLTISVIAMMLMIELSLRVLLAVVSNSDFHTAFRLFELHRDQPRVIREEILEVWLAKKQASLIRGTGLLQLVGLVAPIIGLLGTVIGLITAFDTISVSTGNVKPSLVAEGLGLAMNTTAAGLAIALPCILIANLARLGAQRYIESLGFRLNELSIQSAVLEPAQSDLPKQNQRDQQSRTNHLKASPSNSDWMPAVPNKSNTL